MDILSKTDWENFSHQISEKVVIDAGHVSIGKEDGRVFFGSNKKGPSESERQTWVLGFQIAERLISYGKRCFIHLCFSDTSKNFQSLEERDELKAMIAQQNILSILPSSYREVMGQFSWIPVEYSLQTQNSNYFSRHLKVLKKDIKKLENYGSVFKKYKSLFLSDVNKDVFGLTHPYLLDTLDEDRIMKGSWWLDESVVIHPADAIAAPFINIKKMGVINLYSKSAGILCPATYAGLLFSLDKKADRIAIYARNDDETIGEKVLRGMIASYAVDPELSCRSFLFTIPRNLKKLEISEVSQAVLNKMELSYDNFIERFMNRNLHHYYQGYFYDAPLF